MREIKDHLYIPSQRLHPILKNAGFNVSSTGWSNVLNFTTLISDFILDFFMRLWIWFKIILFYMIGFTSLIVVLIFALKLGFKTLNRFIFVLMY